MQAYEQIRILIKYHDPLVAAGLTAILREQSDFEIVSRAEYEQGQTAADVLIADYEQGLECLTSTTSSCHAPDLESPRVLILTRRDSELEIKHALACGVRGYLTLGCDLDELVNAVRSLYRDMPHLGAVAARKIAESISSAPLTTREMDVLRLLVEGHTNKAIAKQLGIAAGTVKVHLKGVFQKLRVTSRTEVVAVADRRGLLALPSKGYAFGALHAASALNRP